MKDKKTLESYAKDLTPSNVIINVDEETTLFHLNGREEELKVGTTRECNLKEIRAIQRKDIKLVFIQHEDQVIEKIKETEGSFQLIYYFLKFQGEEFVEVKECSDLEFYDLIYYDKKDEDSELQM